MRILYFLFAAGLTLFQSGCAHYSIRRSTRPDQVYVVCGRVLSSDEVYSCDARDGAPICYRTQEFQRQ
jgi:hypothetical protein